MHHHTEACSTIIWLSFKLILVNVQVQITNSDDLVYAFNELQGLAPVAGDFILALGAGYFNLPEQALNNVALVIQGTGSTKTKMFTTGAGLALNNQTKLVLKDIYLESSGGTAAMPHLCHT
jgi:hypothetical protein